MAQMFYPQIVNCPPSLKLIVKFSRWFGLSYSGAILQQTSPNLSDSTKLYFASHLFLIFNLVFIGNTFLMGFINISFANLQQGGNFTQGNASTGTLSDNFYYSSMLGSVRMYNDGVSHFKPILRNLFQSMIYIFLVDNLLNYTHNLIGGGRLLITLTQIPAIQQLDRNQKLAWTIFGTFASLNLGFMIFAYTVYSKNYFQVLADWLQETRPLPNEELFEMGLFFCAFIMGPINFFAESNTTFFYVYSMIIFKRAIEQLQKEISNSRCHFFDEIILYKIKLRLKALSDHFRVILSQQSLSLTCLSICNIHIIISSVCYFIVTQNQEKNGLFLMFIFVYGGFTFTRLLTVCIAASWTTLAYQSFLIQLYEQIGHWTLNRWLLYRSIKQLKRKFRSTIWATYSLKQSTILTSLAFALSYIVVFLQTENYDTNPGVLTSQENMSQN